MLARPFEWETQMSASATVPVMIFSSAQHAHVARSMLDAHEIPCSVTGDQLASTFSIYGNVTTRIELWVKREDLQEASEILEELNEKATEPNPWGQDHKSSWFCTDCNEVNENNFDECWSCGAERSPDAKPVPADFDSPAVAASTDATAISPDESPYRVPASDNEVTTRPVDNRLPSRALRTALYGGVAPILMPYAFWLSLRCIVEGKFTGKFWLAFFISSFTMLASLAVLFMR